jgi:hypothetical protein
MDTRAELHAILDVLDDDELFAAEMHLKGILLRRQQTPPSEPGDARFRQRSEEFRALAEQHWKKAGRRAKASGGIVSGFGGGGGFSFDFKGRPTGKLSYKYTNLDECFEEPLRFVVGQEIEIQERFALSDDGKELLYEQIIKSGGRVEQSTESFPHGELPQ